MSTNWKPGMKAITVGIDTNDPVYQRIRHSEYGPSVGEIVTVTWCGYVRGLLGLRLKEYPNETIGYLASCFRPATPLELQVTRIEEAFVSAPAEGETLETVEV